MNAIARPHYLERLIAARGSGQVKIVTGIRRCGKSFLVFNIFKDWLLGNEVPERNVFEMAFDRYGNRRFRDPEVFFPYMEDWLAKTSGQRYVLLDEVQLLDDFSEVLIDLIARDGVDVYVTGSNARLLSKDVVTEFRGRGQEMAMVPLSFSEFFAARGGDRRDAYEEYATYGGLPAILSRQAPQEKAAYLTGLYNELYLTDIVERNGVRQQGNLEDLIDVLSSSIGSLTNPKRISDTFKSEKRANVAPDTVERYITYLEDAFLVRRAKRYDIKGRRYIGSPMKWYFTDLGLRNARMNFRQVEGTHIMENVIFNELVGRGWGVDVGVVPAVARDAEGRQRRSQLEIDFVCNRGSDRLYLQSAFALPTAEKWEQEERPLLRTGDGFGKIVVTKESAAPHYDQNGVLVMNVYDFLLDEDSLGSHVAGGAR